MRASLEESTRTLTRVRGELQVAQGQLTVAKKELADLQAKVAQLEPMAQRYEALKDRWRRWSWMRTGKPRPRWTRRRARLPSSGQDAAQWVAQLSGSYEAIRDQVKACAQTAEAACHAFEAAEEDYQSLRRRVTEETKQESGVGAQ